MEVNTVWAEPSPSPCPDQALQRERRRFVARKQVRGIGDIGGLDSHLARVAGPSRHRTARLRIPDLPAAPLAPHEAHPRAGII